MLWRWIHCSAFDRLKRQGLLGNYDSQGSGGWRGWVVERAVFHNPQVVEQPDRVDLALDTVRFTRPVFRALL